MKKTTIFLLIALLSVSLILQSCNNEPEKSSQITSESKSETESAVDIDLKGSTISIVADWKWDDMLKPGVSEGNDRWQARIAKAQNDFNCEIDFKTMTYSNRAQSITARMLSGESPGDIIWVRSSTFMVWSKGDMLEDLRQYNAIDMDNTDVWFNVTTEASTIESKTYAVWSSEPNFYSLIAFNKKIFEDKGIENPYYYVERNEWTIDKMMELAIQVTDVGDSGSGNQIWGFAPYNEASLVAAMVNSYDGSIIENKNGKYLFALDSDNSMQALNKIVEFARSGSLYIGREGAAYDQSLKDFEAGNVAMFETAQWMLSRMAEVDGLEYGVTYFPKINPSDEYVSTSTLWNGWGIPKTATNDKEGIAHVLNMVWGDYELTDEEREDVAIANLERITKDKESIDCIMDVYLNNRIDYILNGEDLGLHWNIQEPTCLHPDAYMSIIRGEATPLQAISARKDAIQAFLDESFN